jgi:hypothetical protein
VNYSVNYAEASNILGALALALPALITIVRGFVILERRLASMTARIELNHATTQALIEKNAATTTLLIQTSDTSTKTLIAGLDARITRLENRRTYTRKVNERTCP